MMPIELLDSCVRSQEQGLSFIVLVVSDRRVRGERIHVMRGLLGRPVGSNEKGIIVSVKIDDVMRWMVKHLAEIERWAVHAMEAGDDATAKERLRQFELVRDRLGALLQPAVDQRVSARLQKTSSRCSPRSTPSGARTSRL